MKESLLPGCVWRGEEGDGSSFQCLHPENKKTVTPEICQQCPLRQESHLPSQEFTPKETDSVMEYVAHGATGLLKSAIGVDRPPEDVIQKRWEICKSCEFHKFWRCQKCGCLVPAKIRQKSEACPINLWRAEV